jgi:hypothetical protein
MLAADGRDNTAVVPDAVFAARYTARGISKTQD